MNLLVTGAFGWTEKELAELRRLGHRVILMPIERDPLPCDAEWVEGVVCNGLFLHHPIEKFTSLRYIQLTSAGFDRVPLDDVKEKHICLHNARGVYSIPMAEFALWGVLELYKKGRFFEKNQEQKVFLKHRGLQELYGKTVCIVGCGSVGSECAKRFGAFGCHVKGVDLIPHESEGFECVLPLSHIDEALADSDVVVLSLPLTEESRHLMNRERFAAMKQGSVLVNIARGAVVDTDALITALSERLDGAVLDVFEEEPLPAESPLWELEHVILTPHNSFVGEGNHRRMWQTILNNIAEKR